MIERAFDNATGIIRVKVSGPWDASEIDRHYTQLRALIETVRARSIPIRILVDIRDAPPRPPSVEAQIARHNPSTYRPGDRVAILTGDLEDKEHVRTFLDGAGKWAWQNELAAEQWLLLDQDEQEIS